MDDNVKNQFKEARKLYDLKKYEESLNLYEQLYNENIDDFDLNSKISYCWSIYQVNVKNFTDIDELYDSVEFICELIPRLDLINPYILDEKRNKSNGRTFRSRKEKYYDYASKSFLECADWDLCIEFSKEALNTLKTFTNNGDTWYRWRIAKALKELNQNYEALNYLTEVLEVKEEWFVFKEIIENYFILNENEKALEYVPGAILTNGSIKMKVNLYYLIYNLLKDLDYEMALKHAQLYYLIKLENNSEVSNDIENLNFNENELNREELIKEINKYWYDFRLNLKFKQNRVVKYFKNDESLKTVSIRGE